MMVESRDWLGKYWHGGEQRALECGVDWSAGGAGPNPPLTAILPSLDGVS